VKKKATAITLATLMGASAILNGVPNTVFAHENTENIVYETEISERENTSIPNVRISTNIMDSTSFKPNSNFELTFDIQTENNKIIKKDDKIIIKLPQNVLFNPVLDATGEISPDKIRVYIDTPTGILTIKFIDNIEFTGNMKFVVNLVVNQNKVENFPIGGEYHRNNENIPLDIENNIFSSEGITNAEYRLLSPYWNVTYPNYIGNNQENIGQFLLTQNKAGFYVDVNSKGNYSGQSFDVTLELYNQILLEDSIRVYKYPTLGSLDGETQIFEENIEINKNTISVKQELNDNSWYRVYYEVLVLNDTENLISQYYGNSNGILDSYNPILKSKMTYKKAENNFIPVISGPAFTTLKLNDSFDERLGIVARDLEDGNITENIQIKFTDVNTHTPGTYKIIYQVQDNANNVVEFERIVKVITDNPPVIQGVKNHIIPIGGKFNPMNGVSAYDQEDKDITKKIEVIGSVDTNVLGEYKIVYKVEDLDGNIDVKESFVKVVPKMEGLNHTPTINATDKVLTVGDTFNPLDGVTAHDVDMSQAGTYSITYKVTDSKGASSLKTITVVVNPKMEELNHIPTINATDKVLTVGDTFNPLDGVTAHDKEDGEIKLSEANIIANDVDMSQAGTYSITYKVTDSKGASSLKTITVTVNERITPPVEKPENKPTEKPSQSGNNNTATSKPDKLPQTGDATNVGLLGMMFASSGGMLLGLFHRKRKKSRK